MARQPRIKSETGIYHVMFRGNNKQYVFSSDDDKLKLLECIEKAKENGLFNLLAYCIMDNHVHLLIKESQSGIGNDIRRITTRYSGWYNSTHHQTGHVFGDRFKSEPVEDDIYLISVMAYIFQNPIKANLCQRAEDYRWSSYQDLHKQSNKLISYGLLDGIIDTKRLDEYTKDRAPFEHIDI